MNWLDMLMWENVLTMPFTGMRLTLFLVILAILLLMCTKIAISRLPLSTRTLFYIGTIALIPLVFVTELSLLSRPGTIQPSRLRDGSLCLTVLSATIKYGKGVYLLIEEPKQEPRYIHVVWEVRFAQAMSRALQAKGMSKQAILLGDAACAAQRGANVSHGGANGSSEGVLVVDNFPAPYPDKVDLEE